MKEFSDSPTDLRANSAPLCLCVSTGAQTPHRLHFMDRTSALSKAIEDAHTPEPVCLKKVEKAMHQYASGHESETQLPYKEACLLSDASTAKATLLLHLRFSWQHDGKQMLKNRFTVVTVPRNALP